MYLQWTATGLCTTKDVSLNCAYLNMDKPARVQHSLSLLTALNTNAEESGG